MKRKTTLILASLVLAVIMTTTGCRPAERPVPVPEQRQQVPGEQIPGGERTPGAPVVPGDERMPGQPLPGQPQPQDRLPQQPAPEQQPGQPVTPRR